MNNKLPGVIIIEGHVQGLSNVRSLGEAGIPVYVVDKTDCIARYSKFCNKFFKCADFIEDSFADFLLELAQKEDIRGWLLMPSNDHAVHTISRNLIRLEVVFKVITPDQSVFIRIYNKQKLLEAAKIGGVTYPISWFPVSLDEEIPNQIKFPVMVKGKFGLNFYKTTGKKAFLINDVVGLRDQLFSLSQMLSVNKLFVQEVVPFTGKNKTLSFCAFCDKGKIKSYWMGLKLREHPIEFGTATFSESVHVSEVIGPAGSLIRELNYTGPCEIEFLMDPRDNNYKLIEINARTWLWVGLARSCGIDFAGMAYNYVNNWEYNYPSKYDLNVKWANHLTDFLYSAIAMARGKLTLSDFIKSYKGKIVNAVLDISDFKPAPMYVLFLLRYLKNR